MRARDRLLTIVVTATLTSAAWILFGSIYYGRQPDGQPEPRPVPTASPTPGLVTGAGAVGKSPAPRAPVQDKVSNYVIPVAGIGAAQLSDTFADRRGGGSRLHEALDIMAPRGTPVVAAAAGTVEKLFLSDAGGQTVYERSPDGRTIYYYAHLDEYAPGLKEGDVLAPGDPVGTVGFTGNASPAGPHLHFAIMQTTPDSKWWEPATAVNPYPLLTGR